MKTKDYHVARDKAVARAEPWDRPREFAIVSTSVWQRRLNRGHSQDSALFHALTIPVR